MGWITVYVRGKSGFQVEVLHNLASSGFKFLPGFANERGLALIWIREKADLRSFKKAIGSKTIFKFRLRFFPSVEEFIESKHNAENLQDDSVLDDTILSKFKPSVGDHPSIFS
ncbi:MAG: hypothetical protein WKF87_14625 [Chryseolinea sp.]